MVVLFFARRLALMAAIFSTDIASLKDLLRFLWYRQECFTAKLQKFDDMKNDKIKIKHIIMCKN